MLTGDVLSDARVSIGQFNDPYVSITFDAKGGREFERITGDNVKKRMAVVLDNTIYSAPVIQDRITGGRAQITGTFTTQEANDLAIVLRAGALPAPLKIIQDLTVGPSLGKDSIEKGVQSDPFAGRHGGGVHDGLLPPVRSDCRFRTDAQPDLFDRSLIGPERQR